MYHRRGILESDSASLFRLADVILPNGVLRVDKYTGKERNIHLGHYALPEKSRKIVTTKKKVGSGEAIIIDNGEYQLAMVPLTGWATQQTVFASGRHPEAANSATIVADTKAKNDILISLQIWKKSGQPFTSTELQPVVVKNISSDKNKVSLQFTDGSIKTITFNNP